MLTQFLFVLGAIIIGARLGGIGLGVMGGYAADPVLLKRLEMKASPGGIPHSGTQKSRQNLNDPVGLKPNILRA